MFVLILLEKLEHALVNYAQRKGFKHFQMGVVSVRKTSVHKSTVVNCPHLVKEVI